MKKLCFQHLFVHVAKMQVNVCLLIYLWFGHRNILVAQRISWNSEQSVKQVDASQRFLRGLQSLPSFAETRSKQRSNFWPQWNECRTSLWKKPTRCSRFSSESLWGPDLSERFKAQLSARTNLIQPSACGKTTVAELSGASALPDSVSVGKPAGQ